MLQSKVLLNLWQADKNAHVATCICLGSPKSAASASAEAEQPMRKIHAKEWAQRRLHEQMQGEDKRKACLRD